MAQPDFKIKLLPYQHPTKKEKETSKKTYCYFYKAALRIDPVAGSPVCNPNVQLFLYQLIRRT